MDVKQVIVIRKDLKMRKGKMITQGAHASMKVFFDRICESKWDDELIIEVTEEMKEWAENSLFTKIVVGIDSEADLLKLYIQAQDNDIPCALVTDSGRTEFHGTPTNTCIAIGPAISSKIDKITGDLKLL